MTDKKTLSVSAAYRKYEQASFRRTLAGVEDVRTGRPDRNDVRYLAEEFERPVWSAVLDLLDAYLADRSEPFPPEIALVIAEPLRELLASGYPATWQVLTQQGGPDTPRVESCKGWAVTFLEAMETRWLGTAMLEFRKPAVLAKRLHCSIADVEAWLTCPDELPEGSTSVPIPSQNRALFYALRQQPTLEGVGKVFAGKDPNTIRGWKRDPRFRGGLKAIQHGANGRAEFLWRCYANAAAGFRALTNNKKMSRKGAV